MYLYPHLDPCCSGVLNLSFSGTINSIPGMLYLLLSAAISMWFHFCILFEFFPIIKKNSLKMTMHLLCLSEEAVLWLYEVFLFLIHNMTFILQGNRRFQPLTVVVDSLLSW